MTPKLPARILGIPSSPLLALGLCTLLAFAFLGLRGIWEPDEGRYTNVALTMLDTGDWISPKRSEEVGHWTKPPLTYWLVASSVEAFGHTPWAARLPIALSFLACMILAGACARRIHPGTGPLAAIVYGTMIVPFVAGQLVTTDFLLAALQALAVYAYLERRFGGQAHRHGWLLLMWAALGLGFVTKGPLPWCRCWCSRSWHGCRPDRASAGIGTRWESACSWPSRCPGTSSCRFGTPDCSSTSWAPNWWTGSPAIALAGTANGMAG
ncbi:ArnT family glycosyltransferase [Xanthomonas theicola]|uniref:ArnT family glycosyltransferase n=1 Tax=Xanthomonas theicola TaxID=56464 RepID=UPI00361C8917